MRAFGLRPIAKVGSAPGGTTGTTKYSIGATKALRSSLATQSS